MYFLLSSYLLLHYLLLYALVSYFHLVIVMIYFSVLAIMTGDGFQSVDFAPSLRTFSGAEERSEQRKNIGGRELIANV